MHRHEREEEALERSEVHRGASGLKRSMSSADVRAASDAEMQQLIVRLHSSLDNEKGILATLRTLPTWARFTILAVTVTTMVDGVFVLSGPVGKGAYPPVALAIWSLSYAALLALVVSRALRPLHRSMEPAGREMAVAAACFMVPFIGALIPAHPLLRSVDTAGSGGDCLALGVALGAAVVLVMRALDRAPESTFRSATIVAAAGGLAANLVLAFYCRRTYPPHLAIEHAPIGVLLLFVCRLVFVRSSLRRAG